MSEINIPPANPLLNYQAHRQEIDRAVQDVLAGGRYIGGAQVKAFEEDFAAYLSTAGVVGVGNGTDALAICLRALGIGAGDLVLSVSHTAVATIAAIEMVGAAPVLVDVGVETSVIDPVSLERTLQYLTGGRVRAVIPVHLYGRPADMTALTEISRRYNLAVVEDCAQAHGATWEARKVGTWGTLGAFSFYPTKNLGGLGDGGAVVGNAKDLLERVRLLREYGWRERYVSHFVGINSRLDEIQAAILRVKLRYLELDNQRRRLIASLYHQGLADIKALCLPETGAVGHVYHQFVVRCEDRDHLQRWLSEMGIGTLVHYPVPVHLQPAYQGRLILDPEGLPVTEKLASQVLSLPIYPELTDRQVETVINAIRRFFR